jgi:peroxiredoxin Q/BCP
MLKINTKAPNFQLLSTSKETYSLKNSLGKYVVIYFYPKDDTPGCTIETNDFNKLLSKFKKLECEIYGISKDNIRSHDKFRDKYKIKFDLLTDKEIKVLKRYKVWGKKKFMGTLKLKITLKKSLKLLENFQRNRKGPLFVRDLQTL